MRQKVTGSANGVYPNHLPRGLSTAGHSIPENKRETGQNEAKAEKKDDTQLRVEAYHDFGERVKPMEYMALYKTCHILV
jgi:hypothetical protein